MTSASFNVGLPDGQRVSSRVLRPPGGGHTNIFGDAELQNPKKQDNLVPCTTLKEHPAEVTNGAQEPEVKENKIEEKATLAQEPKKEEHVTQAPEPAPAPQQEPPRRTRVPPGGFSSGLW